MKQFKFKLQPVLKLREFKEQKLKVELGQINQQIVIVEDKIASIHESLDQSYESQNKSALGGMLGMEIQFYPQYQDGLRADIQRQSSRLHALRLNYMQKLKELKAQRGQVKVMENLKDKYFHEFKKERNKEIEKKNFELYQLSHTHKVKDEHEK